jgi:hypothetical protein
MAEPILACDDPRIFVTIEVALKGGKSLTLRIPRTDYIEESEHDALVAALEAIDKIPVEELPDRKRSRAAVLAMLRPFIPARDYKACEGLPVGPLNEIRDRWFAASAMPLGEYLASGNSSTETTGAPSNTISSSEGGGAETSDAA